MTKIAKSNLPKIAEQVGVIHLMMLLLLFAFSTTVIAAEAGRVTLDGKEIILHDDNTWEYVGAKNTASNNENCVEIVSKVVPASVCLSDQVWQIGSEEGAAEFSFLTKDEKLFLLMITEDAEVPLDSFEKAIVANAQKAAGLVPVDVQKKERIQALGIEWGQMVYTATIDKLAIKYENFFTTINGKGSIQYVFYATPEDHSAMAGEIDRVIRSIKLR